MRPVFRSFAVLALTVAGVVPGLAAASPIAVTPAVVAAERGLELGRGWRYRAGDDPAWADPDLDDSAWESTDANEISRTNRPASGWPGLGWFRMTLDVAPELVGRPVMLSVDQLGASELYLDGRLVRAYGRVSGSPDEESTYNPQGAPVPVVFDRVGRHLLAVRYSCTAGADGSRSLGRILTAGNRPAGFRIAIQDGARSSIDFGRDLVRGAGITVTYVVLLSTVGLFHLFLFLFDRRQRANLYYALFALSFAANVACSFVLGTTHVGYETAALTNAAKQYAIAAMFMFFIAFLNSAFRLRRPPYYAPLLVAWTVAVALSGLVPRPYGPTYDVFVVLFVAAAESLRLLVRALRLGLDGAWIIGAGIVCYSTALTVELLASYLDVIGGWSLQVAVSIGYLLLPVFMSVYLARVFAHTGRDLETKLVEVETLSAQAVEHARLEAELRAENDRRAAELEEARQLQLSMLPARVPEIPGLEIAAYMKPATEVGGDYYDFHVAEDGTLTIAVGDATGHGLKAGTLVTATKGLFNAFAEEPDIRGIFHRSSRALKRLNLRYLYMALTLAKVNGRRVRISAAGMPPALVFRAATNEVEEIAIRGLPLGGSALFPYEVRELELEPGDALVFMSDGFPERFNANGEMLDYDRARDVLAESAREPAAAIVDRFVLAGDDWADGKPQDDDVTFVVLKVRDRPTP